MDRRSLLRIVGAILAAAPLASVAQPGSPRRIGYLGNGNPTTAASQSEALRRGLRELGWIEGQNVVFEYRWADGIPERLPALFGELVGANVDVIVVSGVQAMRAAQQSTSTIAVVFVVLTDPVSTGAVSSFARPGGKMTGLGSQFEELITKQLQLLKEAVPRLSRVALLRHAEGTPALLTAAQSAARSLGLTAVTLTVANVTELEKALDVARRERVGAVHVLPSPYLGAQRVRLIEVIARYRFPACYELRNYVLDGGLMSYGPSIDAMFARAASYIDRIFKGAKPGDLAIERPARFELVINRKTAAALGLTIPPTLLQRADELIQ